jgi:cystathionine beta-synthase
MEAPSSMEEIKSLNSVLEAIGNTPLVRLPADFAPAVACAIFIKLEYLNPSGSTKDRIALSMVRGAEKRGELKPGGRIVECSSGNTGAGLCMVAAALGYDITIVIPDKMSQEKIATIRAMGADVVVTPANVEIEDPRHYTKVAERIAKETPGAWWPNQYHNRDNTSAHHSGTGEEIWAQAEGKVDVFVAGAGTGGTLSGIAAALKHHNPAVKIVGVDPPGSILAGYWKTGKIPPSGPYAVEGVGEEEVPGAWDPQLIDDYVVIPDAESFLMARELASRTGIFGGGSTGMNLAATLQIAKGMPADARVVTLAPDNGRAYLSKVYDDGWMKDCGYLPQIPASTAKVADFLRDKECCAVQAQESLAWAVRQAGERGVHPLPILDGTRLLGVLDENAAATLLSQGKDLEKMTADACLKKSPPVLSLDSPWTELATAMQVHHVVLIETKQEWISITQRDWLRALGRINHQQ